MGGGSVALALVSALGITFVAIATGAVLGRAGLVPMTAKKGISPVLGKVCLPALLFHGMATTDLASVPWGFFGANAAAKLIVCVLVLLCTTQGAVHVKRKSLAKAGVFMLFTTRSAVWSLGLPIFKAIWPVDATLPASELAFNSRVNALPFVCAPVDNLIIMPVALVLILAGNLPAGQALGAAELRRVIYRVAKTPAVMMVLLGLVSTLALGHDGLPAYVLTCASFAAGPYGFLSLFSIGLSLAAGTQHLNGFNEVRRPALLLCAKLLLLPTLTAMLTHALSDNGELAYFGFLYNAMPTTAAVAIFAGDSGVPTQLLTSSILWCTVASGPILLVTGLVARISMISADASLLDTPALAAALDVLSLVAFVGCTVCLLWGVIGKPLVRADRVIVSVCERSASCATKCQYVRSNGLLVAVICGQLAISGGVCDTISTFCVEPIDSSAAPRPTSYARSGAVLVAVHATRLGVTFLGLSTVQQRLAGARQGACRFLGAGRVMSRRCVWLTYAALVALVAAVVGTRMSSDSSAISGCFVLRLDGELKVLALVLDFVCCVVLFTCVGLLAKFPAAAPGVTATAMGPASSSSSTAAAAITTDAPGVGLRSEDKLSVNPGVPDAAAVEGVTASPSVPPPTDGERRVASHEAGDRYGPLLLYEAVLATTMFFGQLVPDDEPAVLLLMDAGLLQTFSVRAFILWLLFGPSLNDVSLGCRVLAHRLFSDCKRQAGKAKEGEGEQLGMEPFEPHSYTSSQIWLKGNQVSDLLLDH